MKSVTRQRKVAARQTLDASKKADKPAKKVLGLNASRQIDAEWYYNLSDVETVVAAVLSELDSDPGAGITLDASETGIVLNVMSSEGEEFTVDVDLETEGDEEPEAAEGEETVEETVDVEEE